MRGNKEEDLEEVTMSDEEEEEEEAEICSLVALNLDNGVEVSKMSSNTYSFLSEMVCEDGPKTAPE